MSMVRYWSPFEEIRQLENEVNNLFRNYGRDEGLRRLSVDIEETPDMYKIEADIPGIKSDNLEVEATSQYLEIKVNVEEETTKEDEDRKFIVRERKRSNMARRISFDKPINTQEAKTNLNNGVLTITLPKLEEAKSVRLIPEEN